MSVLYREKAYLTLGQLVTSWAKQLRVDPGALAHEIVEDLLNNPFPDDPPAARGYCAGIRFTTATNVAGFVTRENLLRLAADRDFLRQASGRIILLKGAILAFADRRALQQPAWWKSNGPKTADIEARILTYLLDWTRDQTPKPTKKGACLECQTRVPRFYLRAFERAWQRLPADLKRARGEHGRPRQ